MESDHRDLRVNKIIIPVNVNSWKQQNVKVKNVKVKENIVMEMVEDVLDMVGEVDTPKLLHLSFAS